MWVGDFALAAPSRIPMSVAYSRLGLPRFDRTVGDSELSPVAGCQIGQFIQENLYHLTLGPSK